MEQLFVIKIGGNVIDDPAFLDRFLKEFASISAKKLLVHGGGKIATRLGDQLGIESHYVDGRRITDESTLDLVTMVYGGLVNKKVVAKLQAEGCNAIGLSGADGNVIPAHKRPAGQIDYGFVGDINQAELRLEPLQLLLDAGWVPVMAPLTHDGSGHMLNTNADTIASCLAVLLSRTYRVRLMYCFEKNGVLSDITNERSVVHHIDQSLFDRLKAEGALAAGILPKLENAFAAIGQGVQEVLIGHARQLLANTGDSVSGTLIQA